MNEGRTVVVGKAYAVLDSNNSDAVPIFDIKCKFNARVHPDVVEKIRSEDDVLLEFLETFDMHHTFLWETPGTDETCLKEFEEYYTYVSATIDNDHRFCAVVSTVWKREEPKDRRKEEEKEEAKKDITPKKYTFLGQSKQSYKKGTSNKPSVDNALYLNSELENRTKAAEKQSYVPRLAEATIQRVRKMFVEKGMRSILGFVKQLRVRKNPLSKHL